MEWRGQLRSQTPAEGGRFENEGVGGDGRKAPPLATAAATSEVKGDILVATRQYAKRQLTWFAREPSLRRVMLTGTQPISAVLPSLL